MFPPDLISRMRQAGAEADLLVREDFVVRGQLLDLIIEVGRASRALAPFLPFPRGRFLAGDHVVEVLVVQDTIVSPHRTRIPALHIGIGLEIGAGDLVTFIGDLRPPIPESVELARQTAAGRPYRFRHYADDAGNVMFGTRPTEAILEQLVAAFEIAQQRIAQQSAQSASRTSRMDRLIDRLHRLGVPLPPSATRG